VRPFLENLFTDPAILRMPGFIRKPLGKFIAFRRTKAASENYAILGGRSPLLPLTEEQGATLQDTLARDMPEVESRCFIAMRYWHPFSDATARAVQEWGADEIVLLPLYPQFSTTTTGSSITAWNDACAKIGLSLPTRTLCCWHSDDAFASATAAMLRQAYEEALPQVKGGAKLRILFSAHGLPETIVKQGDPYQWQVERSVAAVVAQLGLEGLDYQLCYQSRVTPQKWLGPSTEEALEKAAEDKVAVLSTPSPSSPSIPRRWWSWTSSTRNWPTSWACPATSARPRRTATQPSSARFPAWCSGCGIPARGRCAPSPAAGSAPRRIAAARIPA
jgi:ferrochelatase